MWAVWVHAWQLQPALACCLTCGEGPPRNCLRSARPPHLTRAQLNSQRGRTPAARLPPACHPPPACTGRAQPEPAPAFTTMFKGLSKGSQGKGSPKSSPAKGSPKGSPSKHSR